ncbi:hypothetical protein [Intestinirhabdus alba]|jgi:hypothetical protein|uniref:Uncharacterized protein n=1 Tax=Intestinirhabdus alba TaxID=2899544 RepID=A0A6L6IHG9_9ENTR|nr:hypothetical protein [Intestinirhabdus alba]MTH46039.1 hypothetical protein [Intestinirhabdus alba]
MNRSEIERLSDEIIGEAVLSLLKGRGPISKRALIAALGNMAATESDPGRREVIKHVIAEINQGLARGNKASGPQHGRDNEKERKDNVLQLFGERRSQSAKKMH